MGCYNSILKQYNYINDFFGNMRMKEQSIPELAKRIQSKISTDTINWSSWEQLVMTNLGFARVKFILEYRDFWYDAYKLGNIPYLVYSMFLLVKPSLIDYKKSFFDLMKSSFSKLVDSKDEKNGFFVETEYLKKFVKFYVNFISFFPVKYLQMQGKISVTDKEEMEATFNEEEQEKVINKVFENYPIEEEFIKLTDFIDMQYNLLVNHQQIREMMYTS